MKKIFPKRNKGFTLVETLVAISIFSMSLVGLMVLMGQGVANTSYAKNKVIANYLAQEGIEYVRNMRDTYSLYDAGGPTAGWSTFLAQRMALCDMTTGCYFGDIASGAYSDQNQPINSNSHLPISSCGDSTCSTHRMTYDSSNGKYGYSGPATSPFTRKIQISQAGLSSNEAKVYSTVYWVSGNTSYRVMLSENIYNWAD